MIEIQPRKTQHLDANPHARTHQVNWVPVSLLHSLLRLCRLYSSAQPLRMSARNRVLGGGVALLAALFFLVTPGLASVPLPIASKGTLSFTSSFPLDIAVDNVGGYFFVLSNRTIFQVRVQFAVDTSTSDFLSDLPPCSPLLCRSTAWIPLYQLSPPYLWWEIINLGS